MGCDPADEGMDASSFAAATGIGGPAEGALMGADPDDEGLDGSSDDDPDGDDLDEDDPDEDDPDEELERLRAGLSGHGFGPAGVD